MNRSLSIDFQGVKQRYLEPGSGQSLTNPILSFLKMVQMSFQLYVNIAGDNNITFVIGATDIT